jgi:hypothetical protein
VAVGAFLPDETRDTQLTRIESRREFQKRTPEVSDW